MLTLTYEQVLQLNAFICEQINELPADEEPSTMDQEKLRYALMKTHKGLKRLMLVMQELGTNQLPA